MGPTGYTELRGHIGSYFVAAFTDARPNGGVQIGGPGTETRGHGFHRARRNARRRAAPAGVHRRHGAMPFVHEQDRNAVGGLYRDHRSRRVFQQRIPLTQHAAAAFRRHTRRRMNLLQSGEVSKQRGDIGLPGAEPVDQPIERIELADAIDLAVVLVEHN